MVMSNLNVMSPELLVQEGSAFTEASKLSPFMFKLSSQIFRNEFAPIRSIVVLRQAPENTVETLKPAEAFRLIYSDFQQQPAVIF